MIRRGAGGRQSAGKSEAFRMSLFSGLAQRQLEPEDMDDPGIDSHLLFGALRGLTTINFVSASARIVWSPIKRLARELKSDRLRVLDIATGAGDIPRALWNRSRRAGLTLEIQGLDISERSLAFAREKIPAGAPLTFSRLDALADSLPGDYDVVMCSLFLHHLTEQAAELLLRKMATAARHLILVNDLSRGRTGLLLAYLAGRLLSTSPVVRIDAVRSVRAAFTLTEAQSLVDRAGLTGATISRRWPCRYLLQWRKSITPRRAT
jgi:2-polyprenyl-3-methyl-5-hydroxy-6-metoxy-1,4-benzoquinol methylase